MSPGAGGGEIYFAIGDDLKKVEELWKNEGLYVFPVKEDRGVSIE
jgi:phosphomevalonate kinase